MRYIFLLVSVLVSGLYAITSDELVGLHKVTSTEMNSINMPLSGSLVYNTTEQTIYYYTGSVWKKLRAEGNETVINAGNQINITGNGTNNAPYIIGK